MKRLFALLVLAAALAWSQEAPAPAPSHANQEATGAKPTPEHAAEGGTEHAKEAVEHGEAGQEHEMPNEIWWKWANFALLVIALGWLLVKFAGPYYRNRSVAILRDIEESRRMKEEADARAASIEARLANLSADIDKIRTEAHQEIEAESARVRAETERHLATVQHNAEQEIEAAAKTASQQLKAYAADLALKLAEDQLRSRLTPETQDGLVHRFVKDLDRHAGPDGKGSRN